MYANPCGNTLPHTQKQHTCTLHTENIKCCAHTRTHIHTQTGKSERFFVPEAESVPTPSVRPVRSLTTQWKGKCSASSNLDWQAYLYYWVSYVSLQKRQAGFDTDECLVSSLPRYRGQLDWTRPSLSQSWCRKNWLPNYLPIHFWISL